MRIRRIRGLVALAVVLLVVIGLVVRTGLGTPSALGWRDIAALCPVGALEALAGAHALLVHPLVLLVAVLAIAFAIGKAFCAWACPVPHLRHFFRPGLRGDGAQAADAGDGDADATSAATATPTSAPADAAPGAPLPPVGGARDGRRIDSRHAVLAGAVASSFAFGFPVFCLVCPVGLTFAFIIGLCTSSASTRRRGACSSCLSSSSWRWWCSAAGARRSAPSARCSRLSRPTAGSSGR